MNDQTIPADKVEKIVDAMRVAMRRDENTYSYAQFLDDMSGYITDLEALLHAPPTLADMNDEERKECLRMQADVVNHTERYVIVNPHDRHGDAVVIDDDGGIEWFLPDLVTPRPDLPRMEWPGTEKPAPAPAMPDGWRLADHPKHGRVIVTNTTPDSDGRVYFVFPDAYTLGYDWLWCAPAELTYLDQEDDTPTGPDHLAVGTVIESADDPRIDALPDGSILLDRDEEATTKRPGAWTGLGNKPIPSEGGEFGPWTVLHIPKEADQ